MDKSPEEVTLHGKTLGSHQELLIGSQLTSRFVVFEGFESLLSGQFQLLESVLHQIAHSVNAQRELDGPAHLVWAVLKQFWKSIVSFKPKELLQK